MNDTLPSKKKTFISCRQVYAGQTSLRKSIFGRESRNSKVIQVSRVKCIRFWSSAAMVNIIKILRYKRICRFQLSYHKNLTWKQNFFRKMPKKVSQQVVQKSPSLGAWITRAAKSIAMIYTYGLVLSVSGAASYFSSQLVKGNIFVWVKTKRILNLFH